MKALLLILALFVVVEAQSAKCPTSNEKATVYFYRVHEANAIRKGSTQLIVSGTKILRMATSSYVGFYLAPGKYELSLGHRETDFLLDAEAGKRYFFRVSNTAAGVSSLKLLIPMTEEQARYQMTKIKPLSPDNLKDRKFERCDAP